METERICPSCHKPLPPDMPLGLCPECLLKAGLNTGTEPGTGAAPGAGFVPPPVADIARLFPQLEILEFIGKGGMGAVYKARQPALDRLVALKILPPAAASGPGFAERFNREARALARLSHPNIVIVHDFGQVSAAGLPNAPAGTLHYLVMEYVDGGNLRQIERAGKLTPEQALAIVPQICEALQFAHNEGIVHRDIKPENILLDKRGRVKITDFGIAKILGLTAEQAPLTGVQDVVGTPHYMAPEQIEKPRTVDHRADIYSLGVVFYEMLTGELPIGKFAPPSRKVQVDVRLDEVVLHALEKEPALRYQQASDVKTAIETISQAPPPPPKLDPVALEATLLARDWHLDIGSCISRAVALVRQDLWPTLGITWLVLVLLGAVTSASQTVHTAGHMTIDPSIVGVLLTGPLLGGLWLFFLKKIRGEAVRVETAFSGFTIALLHLILGSFVSGVLTMLGLLCCVLPGVYLFAAWFFTLPLIIDKRLDFWPAMRISRKVISKHWWTFFAFLLVLLVMNIAGLLACGVGLAFTIPVSFAALMYAYEDIIGPCGATAPEAAPAPAPASPPGAAPQPAEQPAGPGTLGPAPFAGLAPQLPFSALGAGSWATRTASCLLTLVLLAVVGAAVLAGGVPGVAISVGVGMLALVALMFVAFSRASHTFLALFLPVLLVVFSAAAAITALLPESYLSSTRLKVTRADTQDQSTNSPSPAARSYDPYLTATEGEVIQSEKVLGPVIEHLDLNKKWGRRHNGGQPLKPAESLALLKSQIEIHPLRNTSLIEVRAYSDNAKQAAALANEIARVYSDQSSEGPLNVEIVDRATPAFRPIRPDKPLNLAIGLGVGLVLGTLVGAVRASRHA